MSRHEIILRDKNTVKDGHRLDLMIPNMFLNWMLLNLVVSVKVVKNSESFIDSKVSAKIEPQACK